MKSYGLYDLPCVTSCKFTDKKKEWIGRDGVPDLFNVDITCSVSESLKVSLIE